MTLSFLLVRTYETWSLCTDMNRVYMLTWLDPGWDLTWFQIHLLSRVDEFEFALGTFTGRTESDTCRVALQQVCRKPLQTLRTTG